MKLNAQCMCCQIRRQEANIRSFEDEEKKLEYMKAVCKRMSEAGDEDCSPSLGREFKNYFQQFWGLPERDFTEINKDFNALMMGLSPQLEEIIEASPDPLEAALIYARIGNYIDFAALPNVDKEEMLSLLQEENKAPLDAEEYARFLQDLSTAKSLVYLTDNCGEIVLDKIVIRLLKRLYPNLAVTVIVRGAPTDNDATLADAEMCGLTDLVQVIGNGSNVSGTWLPGLSEEARTLIEQADLLISKGQGNYEALHGCGFNIYYLFLCKCDWFMKLFQAERFQGMFVNENRVIQCC